MATAPRAGALCPDAAALPARVIRVYTPHGGSLHYPLDTLKGAFYGQLERTLMNSTDLFLFESAFAPPNTYQRTVGVPTSRRGALRVQRRHRGGVRAGAEGRGRHRRRSMSASSGTSRAPTC